MDGVHRRAVLEMPLRRPPVQLGDPASRRVPELRAQQLREEMVVAIPGRLRVEPLDEDVVGDEALREVSAVRAFGHGIREIGREPLGDGGREEEVARLVGLSPQHFGQEVLRRGTLVEVDRLERRHLRASGPVCERE